MKKKVKNNRSGVDNSDFVVDGQMPSSEEGFGIRATDIYIDRGDHKEPYSCKKRFGGIDLKIKKERGGKLLCIYVKNNKALSYRIVCADTLKAVIDPKEGTIKCIMKPVDELLENLNE